MELHLAPHGRDNIGRPGLYQTQVYIKRRRPDSRVFVGSGGEVSRVPCPTKYSRQLDGLPVFPSPSGVGRQLEDGVPSDFPVFPPSSPVKVSGPSGRISKT